MLVALVLGVAVSAAGAAEPRPSAVPSPEDATTRWSTKRVFRVHYDSTPSPVPLLALHQWTIAIADADARPVDGATVTVLGGMPAHAHGLPTVPTVKELGGGRYLVEGLKFHMPGAWVVAFRIKAGARVDSVSFPFELP